MYNLTYIPDSLSFTVSAVKRLNAEQGQFYTKWGPGQFLTFSTFAKITHAEILYCMTEASHQNKGPINK